jgi:heat shock protein HslJ
MMKKLFHNHYPGAFVFLAFVLLACQPLADRQGDGASGYPAELLGTWRLLTIGDEAVLESSAARIQFSAEGEVTGNASCNRFFGKYRVEQGRLTIGPLGSTRMMCLPALMAQEDKLLELLPEVSRYSREADSLKLYDAAGVELFSTQAEPED